MGLLRLHVEEIEAGKVFFSVEVDTFERHVWQHQRIVLGDHILEFITVYDRLNRLVLPFLKFNLNLCEDGLNKAIICNIFALVLSCKIAGVQLYPLTARC